MRSFIILCLVAVACADKLGYNYQPVGHSDAGLSFSPGAVGDGSDGAAAGNLGAAGPVQGGGGGFDGGVATNDAPSYSPAAAELDKEFITYSANEEDFNEPDASNQVSQSLKQGLRVVFIKGPENRGLENAALALAKQASDSQTAIYVLNKQADIGDLANKLNAIRNDNHNKPEVHFVKYRTPEDAANAQQQIQSQYDSLGGSSRSHHGGVAPVLNFASQAPAAASHAADHGSYGGGAAAATAPSASYLPASLFRRRFRL